MAEMYSVRAEVLRTAPCNSWVVLTEDETVILAVGATCEEVISKCRKAEISDPILIKTPNAWYPFSL
jgi:hypothetical protein